MPNDWSNKLVNAFPQTPVCTANQPIMEINVIRLTNMRAPVFPKPPTDVIHVGTPRSLPIMPMRQNSTITMM